LKEEVEMDIKVGDKVQVRFDDPFLDKVLGKPVGIVKSFDDNQDKFGVAISDDLGQETLFWYPQSQLKIFV
jgi:hypothetical protein|tara:strand:- start:82 stop:294 length:213 start_codon:yes stop_codon:yes gene_type:complete